MIPAYVQTILSLLDDAGGKPYLVGGCVRDTLMGLVPHDYDITTKLVPAALQELFAARGYRVITEGIRFGTVGVIAGGGVVEITPYRTESGYEDFRHPDDVRFVDDIALDLARRDFTVNAMAMDKDGNLLDLFGGRDDLARGVIRCVGDPMARFTEDALRILRALRFAVRFGFTIEEKTKKAMLETRALLHRIAAERIRSELCGILLGAAGPLPDVCTDVIAEVLPPFHEAPSLSSLPKDFPLRLYACVRGTSEKEIESICRDLRLSNAEADKLRDLSRMDALLFPLSENGRLALSPPVRRCVCDFGKERMIDYFDLLGADKTELSAFLSSGVYTLKALAVTGNDASSLPNIPRDRIGAALKDALYAVANGETANTKEDVTRFLSVWRE